MELLLGTRVEAIDPQAGGLRLADGSTHVVDRVLLTTGGQPRRLTLDGGDAANVHYLRKAIIILNPVEPEMIMRDTVFCALEPGADTGAIAAAIYRRVQEVQTYVPGYQLRGEPQFDEPHELWNGLGRVAVFLEVTGNGDFLPPWAGNLDIMTAAAVRVVETLAAVGTSA